MTSNLLPVLETVLSDISYYNQEMEIVNPEGINAALQDILSAQEGKDYVLLADLLELQLLPFLQSLQEAIRVYDGSTINSDIWNRNMEILQKKDNGLWKELVSYHTQYEKKSSTDSWQGTHHLEDTNSGAFTLAGLDDLGAYYYHSNINPITEAADFARYYYNPLSSTYVLWGLGLGYHIRELMNLDDGIALSVYENDIDVIYHCLMVTDMSVCLVNPAFLLIYDSDFSKMLEKLDHISQNFILHYPSLRHIKDKRIREQMEMFFIRDSGKRNAEILFESNSRENFKHYDGYVDELREKFEGKKAIIVAAGPSLDKNVELLKNKGKDTVILATETVFYKLIHLGIDIDYMIVSDANSRIYAHIRGLENEQIPMLYLSTTYKGFATNYQGKKYLICQNGYDRAEELAKKNNWNLYETGGSVSTTALDVCIQLGCNEIAFIGLDLAYTDNLAHASGTSKRDAGETKDMEQIPAIGGGTVPASKLFIIYRKWIEKRVKQPDVTMPIYDATEGGAKVDGLQLITLQEYLEKIE